MQDIIVQMINQYGYFGIFLLITVENIFPPIPSEVILLMAGFMTTYTQMQIYMVILISTIGSVFGAIILYFFGKFLTMQRLEQWPTSKLGRALHFKKNDLRKARNWFSRHGNSTVFFCRCVPIVRSLISIPAGMSHMHFGVFIILTAAGSLVWNTILVYLGAFMGESWQDILKYLDMYSHLTILVLSIIVIIFCIVFYKKRFKKNS